MKKIGVLAEELSERLELPAEALGALRLTVTGSSRALVENHRGLLEYGPELIRVSGGRGGLSLRGDGLCLEAMNGTELLIRGRILAAEWE